jgi:CheY-like chemotaxis protein
MDRPPTRLVLVVEDDLDVRNPLVKFLELHGFSTVSAGTADEAIEALAKDSVAAAIIDLRLRGRSGRDVVLAASPEIPVLIFSGDPSDTDESKLWNSTRPQSRSVPRANGRRRYTGPASWSPPSTRRRQRRPATQSRRCSVTR